MKHIKIKICSYRAAQRYTARRVIQSAMPELEKDWPEMQVEITEVGDVKEILKYTPVIVHTSLLINERLVCAGRMPKKAEMVAWLDEAARQLHASNSK